MATTTSITTSYAGEFTGKIISAALLSGKTINNGGITVKPNVKYKEVIKVLSVGDLSANATCDFSPTGSVTQVERYLTPKQLQVNLQLCKNDFRSDWEAISMGYSSFDVLPKNFADYLVGLVADKVAQEIEQNIWSGAVGVNGKFDGLQTLATADATVIDVSGVSIGAGGITASNVITELNKIVNAIPDTIYGSEGLNIYLPKNFVKAYISALGGFGASGLGANGTDGKGTQWYNSGSDLNFLGIPIFVAEGMTANWAMVAKSDNLFFGTGLLSDENEVKVLDQSEITGSQNVNVIMRYSACTNYGIGSEIVLYTPVA